MPSKLPRVIARISPATRRRIEAADAKAGVRVGRWARRALLRAIEDESKKGRHVRIEVNLDTGETEIVRD